MGKIEKEHIKSLITASENIMLSLATYEKKEKLKEKNLSDFCSSIQKKYPEIALIAIADNKSRLMEGKNNELISDSKTYDSIIDSFINNEFKKEGGRDFLIRYYGQSRFYVFVKDVLDGKFLVIFPYRLSFKYMVQLILEILLIIICTIIISAIFYIHLRRSGLISDEPGRPAGMIKENKKSVFLTGKGKKADKTSGKISSLTLDSLNDYIFQLFNIISSKYSPDIISLYLFNNEEKILYKVYELKGQAFIKIESSETDSIDIRNEIGEELKRSSTLIVDKGRKITLPITHRDSLLGAIIIINNKSFTGPEINDIKSNLKIIARPLSDFLLLNDVVTDKATGLYSKTYFNLRLNELKKQFQSRKSNYSILYLSVLPENTRIDDNYLNKMIKAISPVIIKSLKDEDIMIIEDTFFCMLIPDIDLQGSAETAQKIIDSISGYRIKTDRKTTVSPEVFIGLASTEVFNKDGDDLLQEALTNLKRARTLRKSKIESGRKSSV